MTSPDASTEAGLDRQRLIGPTPADTGAELSSQQIDQWRSSGYTFVRGLVPQFLTTELEAAARERFPDPATPEAESYTDFGSAGGLVFPATVHEFNELTLHPKLIAAVASLLGCNPEDLRLTQSDLWPKYARQRRSGSQDNSDQRIHVDYPNHTLAHPTPWERPEAVEMIVYLSDYTQTGGATAVVPREGENDPLYPWPIIDSPGIGDLRYINNRDDAEAYFAEQRPQLAGWRQRLYQRERYANFRSGDILFYRHDTWHRGTPMHAGALRLVMNITYRRAEAEWISTLHTGWAWQAYRDSKYLEKLIAGASLQQRAVIGFPQPQSSYWCEATLEAVQARYGMFGFDITPYADAIAAREKQVT